MWTDHSHVDNNPLCGLFSFFIVNTQVSCERRTKCADSATYEVTDPKAHLPAEVFWSHHWCTGLSPLAAPPERIEYKIALLTYKVMNGMAPRYLGPFVHFADLPGRRALRSAVTNRLTVPAVKLSTIGSRAFSVSGPQTWNQLPEEITSATSRSTFQRHLKTFSFRKSFPDIIADWHFSGPCGTLNYLGHYKKNPHH